MIKLLKENAKLILALGLLCTGYLIFQCLYIPYSAYTGDELWFAHHIYQYTHLLPYRDFLPYKTILGYYLLTPPFFLSQDPAAPLYYARDELAIINTVLLFTISLWSCRFFKPSAILTTLVFIICSQLFLLYSVDLRVDMLTTWAGLISILFFMAHRPALAGLALGISFLISQKALWFWTATDIALIISYFLGANSIFITNSLLPQSGRRWRAAPDEGIDLSWLLISNLTAIIILFIYVAIAATFSSWHTVLNSVFYEAFTQAKITWYARIYYSCWQAILSNGPLFFFLFPMTMLGLLVYKNNADLQRRLFIFIYSCCMVAQLIIYKQPFPYQMVYLMPAFFLLFSDFFSWFPEWIQSNSAPLSRKILFWLTVFSTLMIASINIIFNLPVGYFFMAALPACLYAVIFQFKKEFFLILSLALILTGSILYPLMRFFFIAQEIDGRYQKSMMQLSNDLLKSGGHFFAGSPLLYNQDQSTDGLKNLIGPAIEYLYHPSAKLRPIMISSLYLEPRTSMQVLQDLRRHPPQFYVNNYRIASLPSVIKDFLHANYQHYWGSIYSYAPQIMSGKHPIYLGLSGQYQVMHAPKQGIWLDHHLVKQYEMVKLAKGLHSSESILTYRLSLVFPTAFSSVSSENKEDKWYAVIRAIVI